MARIVQNSMFLKALCMRKAFPISITRLNSSNLAVLAEEKEKVLAELKEELPKPYDGPERDLVNFPRRKRAEEPGKVRFAIFPDEWFTFFYKKTGVTGPYVFGTGLITFLLSKEFYVIDEETSTGVAQVLLLMIFMKKIGPMVRKYLETDSKNELDNWNTNTANNIQTLQNNIEDEKKSQWYMEANDMVIAAKRENVLMQLETEYRRRAMEVYNQVKKRLDYHLDIDTTRRKLEQKHMVDWIVNSVLKSITPQQEKEALQKCLLDLKTLASRA